MFRYAHAQLCYSSASYTIIILDKREEKGLDIVDIDISTCTQKGNVASQPYIGKQNVLILLISIICNSILVEITYCIRFLGFFIANFSKAGNSKPILWIPRERRSKNYKISFHKWFP